MSYEEWYDAEIAPVLLDLAKRCEERGMSFIASVEYAPDERGGTYALNKDAGLAMHMLHICSRTAPNVDAYAMALVKHFRAKGIGHGGSIILSRIIPDETGASQ